MKLDIKIEIDEKKLTEDVSAQLQETMAKKLSFYVAETSGNTVAETVKNQTAKITMEIMDLVKAKIIEDIEENKLLDSVVSKYRLELAKKIVSDILPNIKQNARDLLANVTSRKALTDAVIKGLKQ